MDDFTCQIQCEDVCSDAFLHFYTAQEWAAECERERWELWACVDDVEQRDVWELPVTIEEDWREFWAEVRANA